MTSKMTNDEISIWEALGIAWDILLTVLILTTAFALGGIYLDRLLETGYVFTIIGFILLIFIGHRVLIKKAKKVQNRMSRQDHTSQKT